MLPKLSSATGLLVADEAHRISDRGHDFRPDHRRLRTMLADLPPGVPVPATTATADARVTADVAEQLDTGGSPDTLVLRGPLDRESLSPGVPRLPDAAHRMAWLADRWSSSGGSWTTRAPNPAAAVTTARGRASPPTRPLRRWTPRVDLGRAGVEVEPRRMWPTGLPAIGIDLKGRIPAGEQGSPGRALGRLPDIGWGNRLRPLLTPQAADAPVPDDVARAAVDVPDDVARAAVDVPDDVARAAVDVPDDVARAAVDVPDDVARAVVDVPDDVARAVVDVPADWAKGPGGWTPGVTDAQARPVGMVTLASRSRPRLIHSLGTRIAEVGRLLLLGSIEYTGDADRVPRSNSAQRLKALDGALAVPPALAAAPAEAPGPVLWWTTSRRPDGPWQSPHACSKRPGHAG